jgi:hypothetical protein
VLACESLCTEQSVRKKAIAGRLVTLRGKAYQLYVNILTKLKISHPFLYTSGGQLHGFGNSSLANSHTLIIHNCIYFM